MIATLINSIGILIGTIFGMVFRKKITESIRHAVYTAAGISTLVIGIMMAAKTPRILHLSLALSVGGLLGTILGIEKRIHGLGLILHKALPSKEPKSDHQNQDGIGGGSDFAEGFLSASVLFCVGAMAILGSIAAGTTGDYGILLTKTVMDSFIAVLMTAAKGPGVGFSAISVLVYQGAITLSAVGIAPLMTPLMMDSISGTGGAMILMIALNLLGLSKIQTGNFLPALIIVILLAWLDPRLPGFLRM